MRRNSARAELLLPDHHRYLETLLEELRLRAHDDDPRRLRECWRRFEEELLAHLGAEEEFLLPGFAAANPQEASAIRADHERIRSLVAEIGLSVDLHLLRADAADRLVERLRGHARHEDSMLYPWAEQHPPDWPARVRERLDRRGRGQGSDRRWLREVEALIDGLRVKAHLAGMDAHDRLSELEREVRKLERARRRASDRARAALLVRLRSLAESLGERG